MFGCPVCLRDCIARCRRLNSPTRSAHKQVRCVAFLLPLTSSQLVFFVCLFCCRLLNPACPNAITSPRLSFLPTLLCMCNGAATPCLLILSVNLILKLPARALSRLWGAVNEVRHRTDYQRKLSSPNTLADPMHRHTCTRTHTHTHGHTHTHTRTHAHTRAHTHTLPRVVSG